MIMTIIIIIFFSSSFFFSSIQSPLSLRLESTRMIASVGEAQVVVYVDSLSGTFSAASSLLDGVTSKRVSISTPSRIFENI